MLIDELRDINLIVCPDWANPAAVLADLSPLLAPLFHHPALPHITLLIDTHNLDADHQDGAHLLLLEALLNLSLETPVAADLNVGLTGPLTSAEWRILQPWLNFRIPLPHADQPDLQHLATPPLPTADLATLFDPIVYEAAQLDSWRRWGTYFGDGHQPQTAIAYYDRYLARCSTHADIYLKLSEAWWQANDWPNAIRTLETGIQQCPAAPELHFWLIIRLKQSHCYPAARHHAHTAATQFPADYTFKLLHALMLPESYDTPADITAQRAAFTAGLAHLIQDITLDTPAEQKKALRAIAHHTNFFLSYQAHNDVALQQQYGQFLHRIMAANYPQWVQPRLPEQRPAKIRVGYLSAFLCGWSGTVLFLNWLKYADTENFEIYTYHIGSAVDGVTDLIQASSTQFHHIPQDLEAVCQQVLADRVQVLIFPELGMDATTLCIAGLRLAPIQCMAWGQPVTSGLPTLDYFLSSELMEPDNGQEHYTETLVRLPGVGISYPQIAVPAVQRDRAAFGLRDEAIVYISSQAPYKYLPQHDAIYAQIARQVPQAQFMFLRAGIPRARLDQAFAAVGLNSQDYCVFSPVLPRPDYFDLLSLADIYLDTPDWSGGNTTLDAIACHLPIVTCPGALMRGRHSYGFLQAIGVTETIAVDRTHYITLAVRLATDLAWRHRIQEAMRQSAPQLFDNPIATQHLEVFLRQAIAADFGERCG